MVRTRKQLKQEKLIYQLNNSGSFPKWIDFPLNIEQLNKIKRYNSYEMLGRSQLKEQEYSKWRKQGYRFVNLQNGKFSWRKNDFSYFIEQDLLHYVLWYHGTWEGIKDIYTGKLQDEFSNFKICYWINLLSERTIDNLPHIYFVFPKRSYYQIIKKLNKIIC